METHNLFPPQISNSCSIKSEDCIAATDLRRSGWGAWGEVEEKKRR
jgi:hypothetical protein